MGIISPTPNSVTFSKKKPNLLGFISAQATAGPTSLQHFFNMETHFSAPLFASIISQFHSPHAELKTRTISPADSRSVAVA
jgi:hypothetical protein